MIVATRQLDELEQLIAGPIRILAENVHMEEADALHFDEAAGTSLEGRPSTWGLHQPSKVLVGANSNSRDAFGALAIETITRQLDHHRPRVRRQTVSNRPTPSSLHHQQTGTHSLPHGASTDRGGQRRT